ncbi:MAG: thioredoxin family protein [Phycisphaerales bacterium]|nr:thioredoxin family protein [Phycisphaerales bacterium]
MASTAVHGSTRDAQQNSPSGAVFSSQSFDDALAASRQQGRTLVVMFSAEWCGPCKAMENSTWRDPGVTTWVRDHAIALHVDVDQQRAIADRFNARSLPLLIAFRNGEVVERSLGFKDAQQMQAWLVRVGNSTGSVAPTTTTVVAAQPPNPLPANQQTSSPNQSVAPRTTQIVMPTTTRVIAPAPSTSTKPVQVREVRRVAELHQQLQQQIRENIGDIAKQNAARKSFRERVAAIYAGSINGPSGRAVLDEALRLDNTPWMRIALVQAALDARIKRPELATLLDEAKAKGADVRKTRARLDAMK